MHFFTFWAVCVTAISGTADKTSGPDSTDLLKAGDVVINEMMVDPDPAAGTIDYPEYIELYNKRPFPVHLKNWKLMVGANYKLLPDVIILPDSFLVLASSNAVSLFSDEVNVAGITGFPALTNTGQTVQLMNETGHIISVITYTDAWYKDAVKKEGGFSLEQLDPDNPCTGMENWSASTHKNGGTPGRKNAVAKVNEDKQAPAIHHISVLSPTQLELCFTEPMDSSTLFSPDTYQITNLGTPTLIRPLRPHYDRVQLTLGAPMQEKIVYTVTVGKTLCDCVGNTIVTDDVPIALPLEGNPGDIIINEVLFDPYPGGVDFVEIFNRSDKVIDLKTIALCHYDSVNQVISSVERISVDGNLLFPGEYKVLTENASIVKQQYNTQAPHAFIELENLPSLNADKGDIALKTANAVIDFFAYDTDMHFALLHETKGISLERVSPDQATNVRENWHSAASTNGFATPGFKNSQYIEAIQSGGTITIFPETFTPDNDGRDDLVTLNYRVEEPGWTASIFIYNQNGEQIKTLANNELISTEGNFNWDGTDDERAKEPIGIYVMYVQFLNLSGKLKVFKKVCVLSGKN